ncbi:phage tail protein [Acinetobacter baumannii]|nr:phage tail protein [Acinetobacter baumannii]MDC5407649.1 phage tail protein [Acinetobacter baumannii]
MSYYAKITKAGLAEIVSAMNSNSKVPISLMAFGDGNGDVPEPNENATSLVNEVYRVGINAVYEHKKNPNWLVCEAIIPSAVGGFNIREVALYDETGQEMLAVASYPPTYKPTIEEGAAKIQTIRIIIQVDNTGIFELIIDPDIVLATHEYVIENTAIKVMSVTDLKRHVPKHNLTVELVSFHPDKNEGGGKFICIQSNNLIEDGGTIFKSELVGYENFYWKRINYSYVNPEMFGALGNDPNFDSGSALQKSFLNGHVELSDKSYFTSISLFHRSDFKLTGKGPNKSKIIKTTQNTSGIVDQAAPNNAGIVSYDKDAVLIALPEPGGYVTNCMIDGISLEKAPGLEFTGIGYFAPYIAQSTFDNFYLEIFKTGFYSVNLWMTVWKRCQAKAINGWILGGNEGDLVRGGTSSNFESCWSLSTRQGCYAWSIYNLHSSNFFSASADYIGTPESIAEGIWNIVKCENVTMSNCGSELVHAKKFLRIRESNLKVDGWYFENFYNKYGGATSYLIDIDGSSRVELEKNNFLFNYNIDEFVDSPRFIRVGTSSTLIYAKSNFSYPRITGFDNYSKFSIDSDASSNVEIHTLGYTYIRHRSANLAAPTAPGKFIDTDQGYKTSGELTSTINLNGSVFGLINATAARWNTSLYRLGSIRLWFSPTYQRFFWKDGANPNNEVDGNVLGREIGNVGFTSARPTDPVYLFPGRIYFDKNLGPEGKPIFYTGEKWVDLNGNIV